MSLIGGAASAASTTEPTTASGTAKEKLDNDLNQFLTLLTTQLKNQDPLDPMDSTEFTSQLVQFASVEQQIYQNSNLEKLVSYQETNQVSSMVNFIDKKVQVDGTNLPLENGQAEFTYTMPAGAKSASIIIRDPSGLSVYEQDADLSQGEHQFTWNAQASNGGTAPDGAYQVTVTGLDNQGEILEISQTVFGRVTGIGIDNGETTLFMGDIEVPQAKVLAVKQPSSASN